MEIGLMLKNEPPYLMQQEIATQVQASSLAFLSPCWIQAIVLQQNWKYGHYFREVKTNFLCLPSVQNYCFLRGRIGE